MGLRDIRRIAFERGIGKNYVCKDQKITEALTRLYLTFKDEIILKGGTALNRGYMKDRGRFSEDIDVDFINNDREKAKEYIIKKMESIKGFSIGKPRLMNDTLRFDCYYINELENKDRIQVEFYLGHDRIIGGAETIEVRSPLFSGQSNIMKVYSLESLLARKIVALLNRQDGKDIYDLFNGLKEDYDKNKLRKTLKEVSTFYGLALDDSELHGKFKDIKENMRYIANSTNHYILKDNKIAWEIMFQETESILKGLVR
ncbi:MAG: nucleotidyl transferase AbiEii/AbiGii toxin family protein [Nanobdellota archaeon]